jgi:hypothetical protein
MPSELVCSAVKTFLFAPAGRAPRFRSHPPGPLQQSPQLRAGGVVRHRRLDAPIRGLPPTPPLQGEARDNGLRQIRELHRN